MNEVSLSIIVPCYNESRNIPELLERFSSAIKDRKDIELVLVDNGSRDDTQKVLAEKIKKYTFSRAVKVEVNIGYGFGITAGLKSCRGSHLAFTHADLQCDPNDVIHAYDMLGEIERNGVSALVKGNRKERQNFLSTGLQAIASAVLLEKLDDINGQPKVFPRVLFDAFRNPPKDFGFDLYVQHMAIKNGLKVVSFPVLFSERKHGSSSWASSIFSRFKVILGYLKTIFMLRFGLYR
jgi:glycosyltransferase involved in cell wall biosynthesis